MGSRNKKSRRRRNAQARRAEKKAKRDLERDSGGFTATTWNPAGFDVAESSPGWEPPRFVVGKVYKWDLEVFLRRSMDAGYSSCAGDPSQFYASMTGLWTYSEAPGRMRFTNPQGHVITYPKEPDNPPDRLRLETYEPWTG